MTENKVEDTSVLLDVDGQPLHLPVRLHFKESYWRASAMLPGWTTPGGTVALQGHGAERFVALQDVIRIANVKLVKYKNTRRWQEQAEAGEAHTRGQFKPSVKVMDSAEAPQAVADAARRLCLPYSHPGPRLPLLCAMRDGALVGCAALITPSQCTSSNCAGVNVEVLPERRRRGIGETLVRALGARAKALGYGRMQAVIDADNLATIGLFKKLGFEPTGEPEPGHVRLECDLDLIPPE